MRAFFTALKGNGARLQSEVEPDDGQETQRATRAGNPLAFADRQQAQKDVSATAQTTLLSCIWPHQAIRANTYG